TLGYIGHKVAHAALGCATGAIAGTSCSSRAVGAAVAEMAAEAYLGSLDTTKYTGADLDAVRAQVTQVSKLAAATAATLAGLDANEASGAGQVAVENNALETLWDLFSLGVSVAELGFTITDENSDLLDVLLAGGAVVLDGAALLLPFIPGGVGVILKTERIGKNVVVRAEADAAEVFSKQRKYWSSDPIEFSGNRVYQRNDLINPAMIDPKTGKTNLELMQSGRAPLGPDGKSINLHHLTQQQNGAIAEVTQTLHGSNHSVLHMPNNVPSGIGRAQFKSWRKNYWKNRANDF
ncbi:HNH/ENDO VII family nuclease, partial [Rhodospirillum sp. A1_3_36]|uniref:HNH/ENDO VII family nuclease n=1 Tax=Rhodospirillum sp. A1_3_36 TaxID=3391666 RepID=UPI0039A56AE1